MVRQGWGYYVCKTKIKIPAAMDGSTDYPGHINEPWPQGN